MAEPPTQMLKIVLLRSSMKKQASFEGLDVIEKLALLNIYYNRAIKHSITKKGVTFDDGRGS